MQSVWKAITIVAGLAAAVDCGVSQSSFVDCVVRMSGKSPAIKVELVGKRGQAGPRVGGRCGRGPLRPCLQKEQPYSPRVYRC